MSRNKNNLTARQQLFLNELILGKQFNDILSEYHIRPATLMRWTTEQNFIDQWKLCNKVLALRSGSETPGAAIRLAQEARPTTAPTQPPTAPAESPASPTALAPATPPESPEDIEREFIRARHGEEAARGFDRLIQIRKLNQRAATPPTTAPPDPTDSPPFSGVPEGPLTQPQLKPDPQPAQPEAQP